MHALRLRFGVAHGGVVSLVAGMAGHQGLFRVLLQSRYGIRSWFVPRGSVRFLRLQTFSNAAITPSAVRYGKNSCNPWNEARGNIIERAKVTNRRRKRWIP